ncbi:hypothetical protein [Aquifex aeolicus]|uniref:hypothetical protein n=1 Tax=Aquifex aeolicus TaxID=63363 RepID=UPI0013E8CCB5|nr:hypothetical protein [Aquifex aeolicus]
MYVDVLERGAKNWDDFELVMGSGFRMTLGKNKNLLPESDIKLVRKLDERVKTLFQKTKDTRLRQILEAYVDAIERYPL